MMVSPTDEEVSVPEKLVNQYLNIGYRMCPDCDPVMTYSIPEWVPKDPEQESILLLDDFSRANSLFMQAIMALIQFGEYVSWKLPKKCHLLLSSNPEDGQYNVTTLDEAQSSRLLNFNIDFDVKVWSKWADANRMPSPFINFALMTPEIFEKGRNINARSYTIFTNALSSIKDLSKPESLEMISLISKGCFGDNEVISSMFTTFIHNRLDRLITPEDLIKGTWEDAKNNLIDNIYPSGTYRADIASVLTIRLINYLTIFFDRKDNSSNKTDMVIKRIEEIVTYKDRTLLSEDLIYKTIKTLYAAYPQRFAKLIMNPQIRSKIL